MEQLHAIFVHIPSLRVLICQECQVGCVKARIQAHLNIHHKHFSTTTRVEIVQAAWRMPDLACKEDEVVFPVTAIPPIPYLRQFSGGFRCTANSASGRPCGIIYKQQRHMHAHCRAQHGWENSRGRGRPWKGGPRPANQIWVENISYQRLAPGGKLGRLFEVRAPETRQPSEEADPVTQQLEAIFTSTASAIQQSDRDTDTRVELDSHPKITNSWLKRTGWARHLAGLDREWLLELVERPTRHERALHRVCWAVEMVIWKALQASRADVVGSPSMFYIFRREVGGDTNEKPLNTQLKGETMTRYSRVWVRIVCYIWRSHQLEAMRPPDTAVEGAASSVDGDDDADSPTAGVRGKRPPYRFTKDQAQLLERIQVASGVDDDTDRTDLGSDSEDEGELDEEIQEELEGRMLAFLISLLDHEAKDDLYQTALVSSTAMLGVDRDHGWKEAFRYTPALSAIVTVARMLVLYQAVRTRRSRIAELMATEGLSQDDAEELAPGHLDTVQALVNRFMTLTVYGGKPTPIDWILRLRTYGSELAKNTNMEGKIQWVGDEILYGYTRFTMPQLRSMIHGLVEVTRLELHSKLLLLEVDDHGELADGATAAPAIDWDELYDNPAELRNGWSFLQDPRNEFGGVDGKSWLAQRLIHERRLRQLFVDTDATDATVTGGRGVVWRGSEVRRYEKAMRSFREHLLVLVHMTGGMPARGTEVTSVQYMNSANSEGRGIFVEDGLMVYVTRYHKGIGMTARAKVIHRYLPREVGELLFHYLWLVLPFWRLLESAFRRGVVGSISPFIWEPVWEEPWVGPQRRKRKRSKEASELDAGDRKAGASDDGGVPSRETAGGAECMLTGVERWDTNRVRRAISRVSLEYMGTGLHTLAWRHASKAIYRRYINEKAIIRAVVEGDEDGDEGAEDDAFDLQTGHGSKVARAVYARHIDESPFSNQSQRALLRRVSVEWHHFLLFHSALSSALADGSRAAAARNEAEEQEFRRWRQMRAVDLDAQLRLLVGQTAKFRSVQRSAIEAIMRQKSPIVIVMGTGAGKSMAFMLPASCSSGVTVVIVPLISLRGDLKRRCDENSIECVEWSSTKPHEWASVVLVTPESAVSESFGRFIQRQQAMGRLDRIVVDECHVVLDSRGGWRTRMLALRSLVRTKTQMVYLTATMRPRDEVEFIRLMGLPPKEDCCWFRGTTSRQHVAYQVRWYDRKEMDDDAALVQLVEAKKQQYRLPGQIIIYCDTVAKAVRFADVLGCVCYHRAVGSRAEKAKLLQLLTEGRQQVFTATNALGLGVDAPTIRVVIHIGVVRRLQDYAQESGRAGRDGKPSEAIILRAVTHKRNGEPHEGFWGGVDEEMREFITTDGCMRAVLDREMDGRADRRRCEAGEEACQRCRSGSPPPVAVAVADTEQRFTPASEAETTERMEFQRDRSMRRSMSQRETATQSLVALEVQALEEILDEWSKGCVWCRVRKEAYPGHQVVDCTAPEAAIVRDGIRMLQETASFTWYTGCKNCWLPQSLCERWEPRADGGWQFRSGGFCQYPGVLFTMIVAVWTQSTDEFWEWIEQQMATAGEQWQGDLEYHHIVRWMGQKWRWGEVESNRMCWIVVRFFSSR